MKATFQSDIVKATRELTAQQRKQLPFVTAKALTRVAITVRDEANAEINKVFDRPTTATQRAFTSQRAEKADYPNTFAVVDLKDQLAGRISSAQRATRGSRGTLFFSGIPYSLYLASQLAGGKRRHKPFEKALIRAGVMRQDQYAVPARGVPLDAFGNLSKGLIARILSQVSASPDQQQNRSKSKRSTRMFRQSKTNTFFVMRNRSGQAVGIAARQRKTRDVLLILAFVSGPKYGKRLNFEALAERLTKRELSAEFTKAMNDALRTAR